MRRYLNKNEPAMSQNTFASAPAPTFDPNDNNAYLVYIPSAVFVIICPLLMALRIWARLRKGGKLGADDWTAIAALVSGPYLLKGPQIRHLGC